MTVFVIVAGFQLGWAPYVSDYSRYLPADVGVRSTFWWTYLAERPVGDLGLRPRRRDVRRVGPDEPTRCARSAAPATGCSTASASIAVFGLLLGLLSVMAINQYGGMMSMISIRDSFEPVQADGPRSARSASAIMFVMVWGIAQFVGIDRFNTFYGNVLIFLAYLFTPWTAINLVDYFFVRHGQLRHRRDLPAGRDLRALGLARQRRLPRHPGGRWSRSW